MHRHRHLFPRHHAASRHRHEALAVAFTVILIVIVMGVALRAW